MNESALPLAASGSAMGALAVWVDFPRPRMVRSFFLFTESERGASDSIRQTTRAPPGST
jgi:hypothetical protein